ncbi:MAG: hypothetical protein AABX85_03040 [Nanoarchaeota archaeon]
MKRLVTWPLFMFVLVGFISLTNFVHAESCSPTVTLLNQDPYPVIPGEYVKLVFQIEGLANSECGKVYFELIEDYPMKFD